MSVAEPVLNRERAPVPVEALTRFFNRCGEFVVLRNHDVWANLERGGDVDLLVADLDRAVHELRSACGAPLWTCRRSYVYSFFYPWGHIDLLPRLEWRGAIFLDYDRVLRDATKTHGLPRPRIAHEAMVSWFTSLLFGAFFKQRYRQVLLDAADRDGEELRRCLDWAAGKRWGKRLWSLLVSGTPEQSAERAGAIRRAVWWKSFRRQPLGTLPRWLQFWSREIGLRVHPPAPMVAVLGPDGSGKSSVLEQANATLSQTLHQVDLYHWYPRFFSAAQLTRGAVVDPHGKAPRNSLISIAKLIFTVLDWNLCYWLRLSHRRAKNTVLIFDRYYHDLLVDPTRSRFRGPQWLVGLASIFIRKPDLWILLDAPAEVLQSRKAEVSAAESSRQRAAYLDLVKNFKNSVVVDAAQPLPAVVAQVNSAVLRTWE